MSDPPDPADCTDLAPAPVLSPGQIEHYLVEGYVLVSSLVPKDVAARADAAAFRVNKFDPDDPETWKPDNADTEFFDDPDLLAVYTPELLVAAAQLCGHDPFQFPISRPQSSAFVIKLVPEPGPWRVSGEHLDGSGTREYHETWSQPWRMFAMLSASPWRSNPRPATCCF
ncbi:MAG: hypothetical protein ACREIT_03895 [Tepidisphaeraceae bacterium]